MREQIQNFFEARGGMLRHACGFKLANDGVDTRSLQHYRGHKSIQHTVRYSELSPERSVHPASGEHMISPPVTIERPSGENATAKFMYRAFPLLRVWNAAATIVEAEFGIDAEMRSLERITARDC
jgi:hypothetical protein